MRALALVPLGLLVLLQPIPAGSQYLFLDTNGDGVHDSNDQLAASGPTSVDIWIVTDRNRDGLPVVCDDAADVAAGMTINSYMIVLHSAGGDVKWGPMDNRLPFTGRPVCFASYEDTTEATYYHNGWGYRDLFPPGKYRVATPRSSAPNAWRRTATTPTSWATTGSTPTGSARCRPRRAGPTRCKPAGRSGSMPGKHGTRTDRSSRIDGTSATARPLGRQAPSTCTPSRGTTP